MTTGNGSGGDGSASWVGSGSGSVVSRVCDAVTKPALDDRRYRGLELSNGLKAMLISDPTTDKSSASMDVGVGYLADPWELQGLAHFCEHMLFLGTAEYPEENGYQKFLQDHGGYSNAYTSSENTNYYFDVSTDGLQEALDRFSRFFVSPLFSLDGVAREVNAVHSEHEKNLRSDSWRMTQLAASLAKPGHDWRKFGTGSRETLLDSVTEEVKRAKIDGSEMTATITATTPQPTPLPTASTTATDGVARVHGALLDFHARHYSANLMGLAVLGKESLDELQEMVEDMFSDIENKRLKAKEWADHPFGGKEQVGLRVNILPVKDERGLSVIFPIPDTRRHWRSKAGDYLGHLIGHEGPGSLFSELKRRGWVNSLGAGYQTGARGFAFFSVDADLSEEGVDRADDVVRLLFRYVDVLRAAGSPPEWIFEEKKRIAEIQFRFKEKESPSAVTPSIAESLADFPLKDILHCGYDFSEFRPDLIEDLLGLLTPDNVRVSVHDRRFESTCDRTEPWYGTKYSLARIADATLAAWRGDGGDADVGSLRLPDANEFIPSDFDLIVGEEEETSLPSVVAESPYGRMWFKRDDRFSMPKSNLAFDLRSPFAFSDPLSVNLNSLFAELFVDALTELTYAASLAGLNYSFDDTCYGLSLDVYGYNDKLQVFCDLLISKLTSFGEIDAGRYEKLKERYRRDLVNFEAQKPNEHATHFTAEAITELTWTSAELLQSLDNEVTMDKLKEFIPRLLSRLYFEAFSYGNVSKVTAIRQFDSFASTLRDRAGAKPLLPAQHRRLREVSLPDRSSFLYRRVNRVHSSSAVELYFQVGLQTTRSDATAALFSQIINEPAFDTLRTKEQLGYIVWSGERKSADVHGLQLVVQSEVGSPDFLIDRMEAFLAKIGSDILDGSLTQEEFDTHVDSLVTQWLEKPKGLSHQASQWWDEITCCHFNFDRAVVLTDRVKTLTLDDVRQFYRDFIAPDAPKRRRMATVIIPADGNTENKDKNNQNDQVAHQSDGESNVEKESTKDSWKKNPVPSGICPPVIVEDLVRFKAGLGLYPNVKPFVDG